MTSQDILNHPRSCTQRVWAAPVSHAIKRIPLYPGSNNIQVRYLSIRFCSVWSVVLLHADREQATGVARPCYCQRHPYIEHAISRHASQPTPISGVQGCVMDLPGRFDCTMPSERGGHRYCQAWISDSAILPFSTHPPGTLASLHQSNMFKDSNWS